MQRYIKKSLSMLLVVALVVVIAGSPVLAQGAYRDNEPSAEEMAADAVVVRPVGLAAIGVGFVLWVVALPFAVISDSNERAWNKMVVDPAKYTFQRPLGEF